MARTAYRRFGPIRIIRRATCGLLRQAEGKGRSRLRVAVILHLYYQASWREIAGYLGNLGAVSDFDILITLVEGQNSDELKREILAEYPEASIIELPNKGFDVGPFFEALKAIDESRYDVVFKLHSKGTKRPFQYIYGRLFLRRSWFLELYEGLLSSRNTPRVLIRLAGERRPAIAAARSLIIRDPPEKEKRHLRIAEELGYGLEPGYRYVAGTCMAFNQSQLALLKSLGLGIEDFTPTDESSYYDEAHFLERYMCNIDAGSKLIGMPAREIPNAVRRPLERIAGLLYRPAKRLFGG